MSATSPQRRSVTAGFCILPGSGDPVVRLRKAAAQEPATIPKHGRNTRLRYAVTVKRPSQRYDGCGGHLHFPCARAPA